MVTAPRIVFIDDEEMVREVVSEILVEAGYDVLVASTGSQGIDLVRRERPDLVLCDVAMRGLDGYEVLQTLRADPSVSSTPFLFLTSSDTRTDLRTGMVLGADDYLTKPIRSQELLAAVATRLERRKTLQLDADRRVEEIRRSVATLLPHELRTPLTALLTGSELLKEFHRGMKPEEIEHTAASMLKAAQRLNRMAENYILFSELELQRLAPSRTSARSWWGLSGEMAVRDAARETAEQWNRSDDLRLDLGKATVPLSEPHLRKLVAELVDNALKFSPRGRPVTVKLCPATSEVALEVIDQGRGMTADQTREIGAFRQFNRDIFEQQGSGLGYAIVQALVAATGGQWGLESQLDVGTRAWIRWPI